MTDGRRADLEARLAALEARLAARFDRVDRVTIHTVVRSAAGAFDGASLSHFVPILVERLSVAQLKAMPAPPRP